MKEILFVLLPPYADWEAAYLAAVLQQNEGFCVKTVSIGKAPIFSIGGFSINPDYDLSEALERDFAGVILIGGKAWRSAEAAPVSALVRLAMEKRAVLGAICDATVFLGTLGLLNGIDHTSNQLADLRSYAGSAYDGAGHYRQRQAVRCGTVVTANGTAALEFAKEVLLALGAMPEEDAEQWYRFYRLGYYEAMGISAAP